MSKPSIAVLISTYNPNPVFFKQQMDSLYKQTYPCTIFVRDDGSNDEESIRAIKTVEKDGKVIVRWCNNIGYGASFLTLLSEVEGFNYYAFCDQDDIWLPDKIERSVAALSGAAGSCIEPTLYFSHYDFYDRNMNFTGHSAFEGKDTPLSFRNALVDVNILGTTMVFNEKLRKLMIRCDANLPVSHDWWAYLISSGCGNIIEDRQVTVQYRRHGDNSSGVGNSRLQKFVFRIKEFILNDNLSKVRKQIICFAEHYSSELNSDDQKILNLFMPGQRVIKSLRKAMFPKKWRITVPEDLQCRIIFLLGRL